MNNNENETPSEYDEKLITLSNSFFNFFEYEMVQCSKNNAYLAACIMAGAAIENIIMILKIIEEQSIEKLEKETLTTLIDYANEKEWLSHEKIVQIRHYRNYVHPNNFTKNNRKTLLKIEGGELDENNKFIPNTMREDLKEKFKENYKIYEDVIKILLNRLKQTKLQDIRDNHFFTNSGL